MSHIRPIVAALALMFSAAAQASLVFDWAFTGTPGDNYRAGHGTFTVRDWDDGIDGFFDEYTARIAFGTGQTIGPELKPNYKVLTDATGWINDVAVVGMVEKTQFVLDSEGFPIPVSGTGFQGNDNVVLDPNAVGAAGRGFFSFFGASIELVNGDRWNLFVPFASEEGFATTKTISSPEIDESGEYTPTEVTFELRSQEVSPIPVPAAAWLMLSGLGGLFMAGRRRFSPANAG